MDYDRFDLHKSFSYHHRLSSLSLGRPNRTLFTGLRRPPPSLPVIPSNISDISHIDDKKIKDFPGVVGGRTNTYPLKSRWARPYSWKFATVYVPHSENDENRISSTLPYVKIRKVPRK